MKLTKALIDAIALMSNHAELVVNDLKIKHNAQLFDVWAMSVEHAHLVIHTTSLEPATDVDLYMRYLGVLSLLGRQYESAAALRFDESCELIHMALQDAVDAYPDRLELHFRPGAYCRIDVKKEAPKP